jgi:hypothetical protein
MSFSKAALLTLVALFLFLILLILFSNIYCKEEGIAERKARETWGLPFCRCLTVKIPKELQREYFPAFQHGTVYIVLNLDERAPCGIARQAKVLVVDGDAFLLPEEFNNAMIREGVNVNTEKKALEVLATYLNSSFVIWEVGVLEIHGERRLLYNASDIYTFFKEGVCREWCSYINITTSQREWNEQCREWCLSFSEGCKQEINRYKKMIKPPRIHLENETYILDFFTYTDGVIERWRVKVGENGTVTVFAHEVTAEGVCVYWGIPC